MPDEAYMPNGAVINRSIFDELVASTGGDMGFVRDLVAAYLEDSPDQLARMCDALAANDVNTFRRAAHSLKSTSRNFGATELANRALELETLAKTGTLAGAAEKLPGIEEEFGKVKAELSHLV